MPRIPSLLTRSVGMMHQQRMKPHYYWPILVLVCFLNFFPGFVTYEVLRPPIPVYPRGRNAEVLWFQSSYTVREWRWSANYGTTWILNSRYLGAFSGEQSARIKARDLRRKAKLDRLES